MRNIGKKSTVFAVLLAMILSGCAGKMNSAASDTASYHESEAKTGAENKADAGGDDKTEESQVATKEEMTDIKDVSFEGMEAVYAEDLNDGEYDITVDSSSSMFRIVSAKLTVKDGEMSAV
nr:hypothetical protein [Lachnospiraceae bacterium]